MKVIRGHTLHPEVEPQEGRATALRRDGVEVELIRADLLHRAQRGVIEAGDQAHGPAALLRGEVIHGGERRFEAAVFQPVCRARFGLAEEGIVVPNSARAVKIEEKPRAYHAFAYLNLALNTLPFHRGLQPLERELRAPLLALAGVGVKNHHGRAGELRAVR